MRPSSTLREPATGRSVLRRARGELRGVLALGLVVVAAASFAAAFRATSLGLIGLLGGDDDPTVVARDAPPAVVIAVVAAVLALAVWVARRASTGRRRDAGLAAMAAAARGEDEAPSVRATLVRSAATWLASAGLVSIGRESAILETGGAFGSVAARRAGRRRALVAAGIAAGFAAAYHAPLAAVLYVEEHVRIRRDRHAVLYSVVAAALSHVLSVTVLGGHTIFPARQGDYGDVLVLGAIGVVPAALGARLFLALRDRATRAAHDRSGVSRWQAALAVGAVAVIVALVPRTAGNGMEALRAVSTDATIGAALALGVAKLVATAAALGSGTPGGSFSPTLAVSSGWALLTFLGLDAAGVALPDSFWDGMVVAMAVGAAVGLSAPLTAMVVVAEMTGDVTLLPVCAAAVAVVWVLGRRGPLRTRDRASVLRDDDA
ncbi:MAG TPA: chloride channel protein [Acidimicrobiales bacterium]